MMTLRQYVVGLALCGLACFPATADTINVPADQPTIAAAIAVAVAGDVIEIGPGTYYEHSLDTVGKAILIRGAVDLDGSPATTIDATGGGPVFDFRSGEDDQTGIENLRLTGGTGRYFGFSESYNGGGVVCADQSSPTITNCIFEGNSGGNGGGLFSLNSSPRVESCTFISNTADQDGGGIYIQTGVPTFNNCIIHDNTATFGGGVFAALSDAGSSFSNCSIRNNTSQSNGGGMLAIQSDLAINQCTIRYNSSSWGGGIYFQLMDNLVISDCDISYNVAGFGAGILGYYGVFTLEDSDVLRNQAESTAGGIGFVDVVDATISGTTIQENKAVSQYGGAIYMEGTALSVLEGIVVGNTAGNTGGGLALAGTGNTVLLGDATAVCGNSPNQIVGLGTQTGNDTCISEACEACGLFVDEDGQPLDYDQDGLPDYADPDDDNDGVDDADDEYPMDSSESVDSDGDGIGDNLDNYLSNYPHGACCVGTGCTNSTEEACAELGGTWTLAGSCEDCTGTCPADINGDGVVDAQDLTEVLAAWQEPCGV